MPPKPKLLRKKAEHQGEGQRLGDDRQIDAGDAAAEGEPAEHEGQHARHQHDHQRRIGEMVEAVPVPGQLLPVQEHHEVGQDRVGVAAAGADLAHQVHAHGVAAEREEGAVAEREDAAVAPHEVEREGQQGKAQVLAPQRHGGGRHVEGRGRRHEHVEAGHDDGRRRQEPEEDPAAPVRRLEEAARDHASTARPLSANRPRGRLWMNRMTRTSSAILPSTAPA